MAQLGNVLFCAAAMTVFYAIVGLPIAKRISQPCCLLWAPAFGWAVSNALALPLFGWAGMERLTVLTMAGLAVAAALAVSWRQGVWKPKAISIFVVLAVLAAAVLAIGPMAGILPKRTMDGITLASPIFDHSKIAMVDEMLRSGVPLANPFIGEPGTPDRVAYYYLWHFSAALAALASGVSGWEADAALTGFTAFASVMTMAGLALRVGGRMPAAVIAILLAATASLRTTLDWIWPEMIPALIGERSGFGGALFQVSWAPQHVASAMCVVIVCTLLLRLGGRGTWIEAAFAGIIAAAAFECSVWVGGVVLALAAVSIAALCLISIAAAERPRFVLHAASAGAIALLLAMPFIHDQLSAAGMRGHSALIALQPVAVLGSAFPSAIRRVLDVPAYWLVYLPVEFPAYFLAGMAGLFLLFKDRARDAEQQLLVRAIALLTLVSLSVGWLMASVIADNNDLGWRAVLPAVMTLVSISAALISRWPRNDVRMATMVAAAGAIFSLPESVKILHENIDGLRKPSERVFAASPAMWDSARRHTAPTERIANNPAFLSDMTPWPVNISWALLAHRRSCYAGSELAIPFAPIPAARRAEIEAQFIRVFSGDPKPDDIEQLAEHFRCDTIVVTAQDGAWRRDPFSASPFYRLVESKPDAWRIYRKTTQRP
ncbi:MAG: hypothetical protein NTV56_23805 [Alphaproteobacteria bacterium]|nr:hypothetical protein [Alphaproteobacteria bacterium]